MACLGVASITNVWHQELTCVNDVLTQCGPQLDDIPTICNINLRKFYILFITFETPPDSVINTLGFPP